MPVKFLRNALRSAAAVLVCVLGLGGRGAPPAFSQPAAPSDAFERFRFSSSEEPRLKLPSRR